MLTRFHELRRLRISQLTDQNLNPIYQNFACGHAPTSTNQRYVKLRTQENIEAYKKAVILAHSRCYLPNTTKKNKVADKEDIAAYVKVFDSLES